MQLSRYIHFFIVLKEGHPDPGKPYSGISRMAYLPYNEEGEMICRMLKVAFKRKLVFTIGHSRTTGRDGVITWNNIHHKTDQRYKSQYVIFLSFNCKLYQKMFINVFTL